MPDDTRPSAGLRIVTFNALPPAYGLVAGWAERQGHRLVLVVTTPGPPARRGEGYREIVAMTPPERDVLVTTRLRRVAAPLIAALQPDLILAFTFPYRIPPEITAIPRLGAVNLHPTPLPAYRGTNPPRLIYDGWPMLGATLHRIAPDFDTGPILSQHVAPAPADPTPESAMAAWIPTMQAALAEGVARAVAGEPGDAQDEAHASYAAEFTDAEHWLDWDAPAAVVQRRATALNLFGPSAKAIIDGRPHLVRRVERLPDAPPPAPPGALLDRTDDTVTIAVADGALRVTATPLPE